MSNDKDLINRLKNPKQVDMAFRDLLDLYQERLYWHIRKIVLTHDNASDVLQNTFIRVYKGIKNFKEKSTLHTWMYRIAYNESRNSSASHGPHDDKVGPDLFGKCRNLFAWSTFY